MARPRHKPTSASSARNPSTKPPEPSTRPPLSYAPRSHPKRPPPPRTVDPRRLARYRKPALILSGVAALAISFELAFTYCAYTRDAAHYSTIDVPADVSDRYRNVRLAESYDGDVDYMEWLMGMTRLRRQLLAGARGHVLEAAVGTGRNSAAYPLTGGAVKSVTMVDSSADMLRVARLKWAETNPWFINAVFRVQSAAEPVPRPPGVEGSANGGKGKGDFDGFDTVVQTMGVCSTPEPERVLRNLGAMCRQDGQGRILLLEHGRGHYDWLNRWIDRVAPAHADREGCWFNKDVGEVVRRSGLEVVEQRRYHFGTTWWFELKPPTKKQDEEVGDGATPSTGTWMWSWWK